MNDEEHFLSIWVGQRPAGHKRTIRSGEWKLESSQHQSSEGNDEKIAKTVTLFSILRLKTENPTKD